MIALPRVWAQMALARVLFDGEVETADLLRRALLRAWFVSLRRGLHLRVQKGAHTRYVKESFPPELTTAAKTYAPNRTIFEEDIEERTL